MDYALDRIRGRSCAAPVTYNGITIGRVVPRRIGALSAIGVDERCNLGPQAGSNAFIGELMTVDVDIEYAFAAQEYIWLKGSARHDFGITRHCWGMQPSGERYARYPPTGYIPLSGFGSATYTLGAYIVDTEDGLGKESYYDLVVGVYKMDGTKLDEITCPDAIYFVGNIGTTISQVSNLQLAFP